MVFNFDPDAKDDTRIVYHGTRIAPDTIWAEGLKYPGTDTLVTMIEQTFAEAGLSFEAWMDVQKKMRKKGRLTTFTELSRDTRRKVWVTDREDNAWSYANRSPEIVTEAVRNEYLRLHYRKKHVLDEIDQLINKSIAWIGNPVVVVLDAVKIGARGGCNQPIADQIDPSAIIEIKTIKPVTVINNGICVLVV